MNPTCGRNGDSNHTKRLLLNDNPERYRTYTPSFYDQRFHNELSDEFWNPSIHQRLAIKIVSENFQWYLRNNFGYTRSSWNETQRSGCRTFKENINVFRTLRRKRSTATCFFQSPVQYSLVQKRRSDAIIFYELFLGIPDDKNGDR
ncbi:hypothetical protein RhiirA4_419811 [Rhizophagus irregularis]|uniref:Uncharacterized protein n=1 Tax=Rhizophagus irregularis TaxID=588596 RepID=A0A2I1GFK2_9GLOM|nr:hypothetical protein RhiirA4_419811 [Rhizophagus irregularis]